MKKTVLSEDIRYIDGKRVTTQTIETVSSLADDRTEMANFYGTLAALQAQLEQIESAQIEPPQKPVYDGEVARIKSEMATIEQAIGIQQGYIRGFGDGNQG